MQQKKDKSEEAKEVARVEAVRPSPDGLDSGTRLTRSLRMQAAAAAMGLPPPADPSSSRSSSSSSSRPTPAAPPPKPTDPYANYTTAASLGYRDEVAERAAAEAEQRQNEGVIGAWQKVVKPRAPPAPAPVGAAGAAGAAEKGKARARDAEGFAGQAVLRPELAGGVKREDGDAAAAGDDGERKPALRDQDGYSGARPTVSADADDRDDHALPAVEAATKRGFLREKSAADLYDDDDSDDPLAALGPIKLKKRRLTVKEQQAEEEQRLAREREVKEVWRAREERKGKRSKWEAVDPTQEETDTFDPFADAAAAADADPSAGDPSAETAGLASEGKDAAAGKADEATAEEEPKPQPSSSLFKKRKRPGAAGGLKGSNK